MVSSFFRWFLCRSKKPRAPQASSKSVVSRPPPSSPQPPSSPPLSMSASGPLGAGSSPKDPREPRDIPRVWSGSKRSNVQKVWHTPFIRLTNMNGSVMYGKYPSQKHVKLLQDLGVTVFVDLTEGNETIRGTSLSPYITEKKICFPIEEKNVPDDINDFIILVTKLCRFLDKGENIYIHCKNGRGRSALLVAIVLAHSASISYEQAIDEINRAHRRGHGSSPHWKNVVLPPHPIQRRFVRDYLRSRRIRYRHPQN